ncbi:MAG: cation diffusion facilitator family transporter [Eubacteriales bacterium]|nr:cation diffusion facilitator family transporter [Eubacteriales bacterium]
MITLLSRFLIQNPENYQDPKTREAYGTLCGMTGIVLNLLLFAGKWISGVLSGSIAITADAFNNLSDAGSSLISLIGFRMSGQKPDAEHPYGHGRIEYLSALLVSILILLMGFELLKSSLEKVLHPEQIQSSPLILVILMVSIAVKLYMFFYNRTTGRKIDSASMKATAMDSLSDMISTSVVLAATLISSLTGWMLDGWLGLLVSVFILFTGYSTIRDTVTLLLGQPPKPEFVDEIQNIVRRYPSIIGTHDLLVHDYGPGRCIISLHAEVSAHEDLLEIHDEIDNLERVLEEELHCLATIHMDPIVTDDEETSTMYHKVKELAAEIHPKLSIHDFRMVKGTTHTNLIFDVVVPYETGLNDDQIRRKLTDQISAIPEKHYFAVIDIDHM